MFWIDILFSEVLLLSSLISAFISSEIAEEDFSINFGLLFFSGDEGSNGFCAIDEKFFGGDSCLFGVLSDSSSLLLL